jgi:predicted short-subunit dehydrogenase-like oxidoreductase (DUF2520 family)
MPAAFTLFDPASTHSLRLGFVGAGRIARALAQRWQAAGQPVVAVSSRTPASAQTLAGHIAGCRAVASPDDVAAQADVIFLATPDDDLRGVADDLANVAGKMVVHLSGASELSVLDGARQRGALVGAFHPIFLFAGLPDEAQRMGGCSISIEAQEPAADVLRALVATLGCKPLSIPAGQRALYHGAANYAASFVLCLLDEAAVLWEHVGIDRQATFEAMWPLIEGTLASAHSKGLSGALAGPLSRGDVNTVKRHLAAFDALGGDHGALYRTLSLRALSLSRQGPGRRHGEALDTIETLLSAPPAGAA